MCCPDSGAGVHFDPNAYTLYVDGFAFTNARGEYYDCYFNYYSSGGSWTSMWSNNTSVATVASDGELTGTGAGGTDVVGQYEVVYWETDGMDCYQRYGGGEEPAPVDVAPAVIYKTASIPGSQGTFAIFGSNQTADLTATQSQCNPQSNFVLTVTFWLPQDTREVFEVTMEGFGNTSVSEWNVDQESVSHSTNLSVTPQSGDVIGMVNNKNGGQTGTVYNAIQINVKGKYNSGQTFSTLGTVRIDCP